MKSFYVSILVLLMTVSPGLGWAAASRPHSMTLIVHEKFPEVGEDFSGLALIPGTDRYLVADDDGSLFEFDASSGKPVFKRAIKLRGLEDCESVEYLGKTPDGRDRIAVTEERRGRLAIFETAWEPGELFRNQALEIYQLDSGQKFWGRNTGLEALAAASISDNEIIFYFGKEEYPKKIYRGVLKNRKLETSEPWPAQKMLPRKGDIAGLSYFENHLWILDQRLGRVYKVNPATGHRLEVLVLPAAPWFHLYEGLAISRLDSDTIRVAVVAEKNSFYFFEAQEKRAF